MTIAAIPGPRVRTGLALAVHLLCLLPLVYLVTGFVTANLGVNPVETLTHTTGTWAFRILLICLMMTPLSWLTGGWVIRYRRALGDWAFFYACLHFSIYLTFDAVFDWQYILDDILERPYITMGFAGFVMLLPLAVTSNRWSVRRLGAHWKRLHRLIYPAAIAVSIHFLWLVKGFQLEPIVYAGLLGVLLCARLVYKIYRSNS